MKLSRKNLRNMIIKQISLLKEGAEKYGNPTADDGKLTISGVTYQLSGKVGWVPAINVNLKGIKIGDKTAEVTAKAAGQTKTVKMPIDAVAKIAKAAANNQGFTIKNIEFTDETKTPHEIVTATLIGEKIA
jgi:hypothetical protein